MAKCYQFIETRDGSPSLRNLATGEPMHNLAGAFHESLYIYFEGLRKSMSFSSNPHILSVGLGLAYNELISVAYFKKSNICNFKLVSYEKEQTLIDGIREWTHLGERAMGPWARGYEIILAYTADSFGLSKTHLRQALGKLLMMGNGFCGGH